MLVVKNLTKEFRAADRPVKAVDGVSLSVPDGVFASIVGKSGSGKSTLLALLGALDKPTSGSIKVDGQDITKLNDQKLIGYRRDRIGFVFQAYNLIPNLSALENVMLPLELAGASRDVRVSRAAELLERVGLEPAKHIRRPTRLSGGEQQRVAIARALANRPKLILADEPTGNLDSQTGRMIVELLHELAQVEHTTIIAVTHDQEIARQTKLTFRLQDGRLAKT
jgi:putative ABC transport system ATP-binding protein